MINYGKQFIDTADINAVIKVLNSSWLTQGPEVKKFENKLNIFFGSKYSCVVSNGTAALHLAGLALGWKKGDIILTSTLTFLASANCILYSGAKPELIDINESNYNIDIDKLEKKLKKISKKVVAIVATDYAGYPCDWAKLKKIAVKYKIKLINDNCHAIGAKINKNRKYALKHADIVTQSFHPVKHITTGEGGAILSNNKKIIEKVKILRSHGVIKKKSFNPWYYEMQQLGYNYRLSDLQCALGISQLNKINKFVKRRREIANIYNKAFSNDLRFKVPAIKKNYTHSYHLYPLQIKFNNLKITKQSLFKKMLKEKINLQVHYIPLHMQPYYMKNFNFKVGSFPSAEKFYKQEVSLPIYYSLENNEVKKVIKYIKKYCIKK